MKSPVRPLSRIVDIPLWSITPKKRFRFGKKTCDLKQSVATLASLILFGASTICAQAPPGNVSVSEKRFPDYRDDADDDIEIFLKQLEHPWTGPIFQLSQKYPETPPPAEDYPWKQ